MRRGEKGMDVKGRKGRMKVRMVTTQGKRGMRKRRGKGRKREGAGMKGGSTKE